MTDDKWQEIVEKIKSDYDLEEEFQGEIENIPEATFAGVVFFSPAGKYKVTRTKRPKVIDKKTQYSNRVGGEMRVDYVYSDNEFVDDLEVHKWNDLEQDWVKAGMEF